MKIVQYKYQQEAEEQLYNKITEALDSTVKRTDDNTILFAAPVGAGKTKMVAVAADNVAADYPDCAFVFVAPSEGGLHNQATQGFKDYDLQHLKVRNISRFVQEDGHAGCITPGTLNVIGWSDVISSKKNVQRKKGEVPTLQSILEDNYGKTRICLFIDEAHSRQTEKAADFISLLRPYARVNLTATPHVKDSRKAQRNLTFISVSPSEVADEGKIKKWINVNDADRTDGAPLNTTEKGLINLGFTRRNLIAAEAKKVGLDVEPLMIIQVLNDDNSDKTDSDFTRRNADLAKDMLKQLGATDDEIFVWLAEQHDGDPLEIKNTNHKYVITKLAISKGWDCPRACVLVKLRFTSKSDTLDEQTLGRILRTIDVQAWLKNQAYQHNEMLNTAFIYTADEDYDATLSSYSIKSRQYENPMLDAHKKYWKDIHLTAIRPAILKFDDNSSKDDIVKDIVSLFNEKYPYEEQYRQWKKQGSTRKVAQYSAKTAELYDEIAEKGKMATSDHAYVEFNEAEIQSRFWERVRKTPVIKQYKSLIEQAVRKHVERNLYRGKRINNDPFADESHGDIADYDLKNKIEREFFLTLHDCYPMFVEAVEEIINKRSKYGDPYPFDWHAPAIRYSQNDLEKNTYKKYAYEKVVDFDSETERTFVRHILEKYMESWHKDGTHEPDDYCIDWKDDNGRPRKFFPDFFGIRGNTLFILETKGGYDADGDHARDPEMDKCKAKAIRSWLASQYKPDSIQQSSIDNIVFGICRQIYGTWKIYDGAGDDYDDITSPNWKNLIEVIENSK